MTDHQRRRQFVATLGGALAGGTLVASSGDDATASAEVSVGNFTVDDAEATGDVTGVRVTCDAQWGYDLPNDAEAPERWQLVCAVVRDDEVAPVAETTGRAYGAENTGTVTLSGDLLQTELYSASDFALGSRDERSVEIGLRLTYRLNGARTTVATATAHASGVVRVTAAGYDASLYGDVGGTAGFDVTTSD